MNPRVAELAQLCLYPLSRRWSYDWPAIEADLGTALPAEFKEYATYFPPGMHGGVLMIEHPGLRGGVERYRERLIEGAGLYAAFGSDNPDALPFYPSSGGLIPWAQYESTAALCWLPDGDDPDQWPVVAYNEEQEHERIPGSTIQALIAVLRSEAGRRIFPAPFYETLRFASNPLEFDGDEGPSPDVDLPLAELVES